MNRDALPYLEVPTTPDSIRFWRELAAGRVTVPWCATCDTWVWFPRAVCPVCLAAVAGERTLSGEGAIHSFSIVHRGAPGFEDAVPYVSSYVSLDGGPTVLSNIVGTGCLASAIGDRVRFVAPPAGVVGAALRFVRLPT